MLSGYSGTDLSISVRIRAIFRRGSAGKERKMKKKFKMEDLGCANCAAKMEADIKKLEGVNDASVSFMAQKLMLDADDERFEELLQEAQKIVRTYEPDASIIL